MNKNKVMGIIRHMLTFAGGYVTARGWLDEGTVTELIGAAVTITGVLWSYLAPEKS